MTVAEIIWISLVTYSMVQGFILFVIFPTYRNGSSQAKWLLALVSLSIALLLMENMLELLIGYEKLPHLIFAFSPMWYVIGPLLFLYLRLFLIKQEVLLRDFWHFLPAVFIILNSIEFYQFSGEIKLYYLQTLQERPAHPTHQLNFLIFVFQSAYYLYSSWKMLGQSSQEYRKEYQWSVLLIICLGSLAFLSVISMGMMMVGSHANWWSSIYFFIITVFLFALFFKSVRNPRSVYSIGSSPFVSKNPTLLNIDDYQKLMDHMHNERPYKDPSCDLFMLANQLGWSRHYLNQLIRKHTDATCREFINQFRIRDAKQKLTVSYLQKFTIQAIAEDSGFISLATFYRVFKKQVGQTPKAYIKNT